MAFDQQQETEREAKIALSLHMITSFVQLSQSLRAHQKSYFRQQRKSTLLKCKELEKQFDDYVPVVTYHLRRLEELYGVRDSDKRTLGESAMDYLISNGL